MVSPVRIDKTSPIPAYHQISSDLTERIDNGEWSIGDRLPSESELARQYDVSRITLRQALSDLEERGLLTRIQGKGAFLTGQTKPFVEELSFPIPGRTRPGKKHSENRVLELRNEENPPVFVQEAFHWKENPIPLIYLRRVFVQAGRPLGLNHAWFPAQRVPGLLEQGLIDSSITTTLDRRYQYRFAKIENYIEAGSAGAMDAAILECPYGSSLLKIQSAYFLPDETLIELASTFWLGNLTRFHLVIEDQ